MSPLKKSQGTPRGVQTVLGNHRSMVCRILLDCYSLLFKGMRWPRSSRRLQERPCSTGRGQDGEAGKNLACGQRKGLGRLSVARWEEEVGLEKVVRSWLYRDCRETFLPGHKQWITEAWGELGCLNAGWLGLWLLCSLGWSLGFWPGTSAAPKE